MSLTSTTFQVPSSRSPDEATSWPAEFRSSLAQCPSLVICTPTSAVPKNVGCEQTNHVPTMRVTNSCCVAGLAVPFAGVEHAANGSPADRGLGHACRPRRGMWLDRAATRDRQHRNRDERGNRRSASGHAPAYLPCRQGHLGPELRHDDHPQLTGVTIGRLDTARPRGRARLVVCAVWSCRPGGTDDSCVRPVDVICLAWSPRPSTPTLALQAGRRNPPKVRYQPTLRAREPSRSKPGPHRSCADTSPNRSAISTRHARFRFCGRWSMPNLWNRIRRCVFTASRLRDSSAAICWLVDGVA